MTKKIDLTGKIFGNWTVVSPSPSVEGRAMWNCVCSCGNEKVVSAGSLLYGKSRSCGCASRKSGYIGKKFGELTIVRFDGYYKKNPKWVCSCSCGREVSVFENSLKSGAKINCGDISHSDYIGKRFGRLTVLPEYKSTGNARKYLCKCDCGKYIYSTIGNLNSGNTKSCGCLEKELLSKRNRTHGQSNSRIYNIWIKMIERCEKEYSPSYKKYGEKGIKVCEEWHNFTSFFKWSMGNGYNDELTIDRINGTLGYSPENCRWATPQEQANNIKTNLRIEYNGEKKTLAEWSREFSIPYKVLYQRIHKYKWDFERAVTQKVKIVRKKDSGET